MSDALKYPEECEHTRDRIWERYGITTLVSDYDKLCEMTKHAGVILDYEKDNKKRQAIYRVPIWGIDIWVTWCFERECVTTALPPENFNGGKK